MLKKICAAAVLVSVVNVASAAGTYPYVGASLGLINNTNTVSDNTARVYRGVPLNVFVGFGGVSSEGLYLAGELTGTLGSAELDSAFGMKTTYGYGVSIVPGVMLSEHTLAFARAGVVRSRFTDSAEMSTGGQLGLGLQTSLTQNLDLRGEYDFTAYRSVGTNGAPRQDATTLGLVYKFD